MFDWNALNKRALACKNWEWMPGMRIYDAKTNRSWRIMDTPGWCCWVSTNPASPVVDRFDEQHLSKDRAFVRAKANGPTLYDAATVGCLLALVQRRYPHGVTCIPRKPSLYWLEINLGDGTMLTLNGACLADCLVSALAQQVPCGLTARTEHV